MKFRKVLGSLAGASLLLLLGSAYAADPDVATFATVYSAEYYEYAKDGSATLGLVAERLPNNRAKFVMCDNKTVEVSFTDLRQSKGRCGNKLKGGDPWFASANDLAPIYRYTADPANTKVIYKGQVVDLKSFKQWESLGIALPAAKASQPVGYVFKDSDGTKAMAILRDGSSK
jgi:hypothetical protein